MPTYDLGDGVNLRHFVYNRDGDLTDATVAFLITKPNGTTTGPLVTRTSVGQYDAATYVPDAIGEYRYRWTITGTVTDVVYGTFTVADPSPSYYSELPLVKSQLGKITTDDRDELIQASITAASRMIDVECGLWPGAFRPDAVATTRVFELAGRVRPDGYGRYVVSIDPVASATGLVISTGYSITGVYNSWVNGTYAVGPMTALALGEPLTWVKSAAVSLDLVDSIQVTARWGYPSVPAQIELATRMMAARLYRRKDSPQGIIASADWGAVRVSRTDPDIHALLFPFMPPGFA